MLKQKKMIAGMLAMLLAVILFSSVLFIAVEANHDCIGDGCPICCQIQNCENLLKNLTAAVGAACLAAAALYAVCRLTACVSAPVSHLTLVHLKVKLSN